MDGRGLTADEYQFLLRFYHCHVLQRNDDIHRNRKKCQMDMDILHSTNSNGIVTTMIVTFLAHPLFIYLKGKSCYND